MDYCVPLGIPHSLFLGRIVRPGRDPQWTDADRGYALAWQRNKAETCKCGTRAEEWEVDEDAYVSADWTCPGCTRLAEHEQMNLRKDAEGKVLPGQHTYLEPREQFQARMEAKHAPRPPD